MKKNNNKKKNKEKKQRKQEEQEEEKKSLLHDDSKHESITGYDQVKIIVSECPIEFMDYQRIKELVDKLSNYVITTFFQSRAIMSKLTSGQGTSQDIKALEQATLVTRTVMPNYPVPLLKKGISMEETLLMIKTLVFEDTVKDDGTIHYKNLREFVLS